MSYDGIRRTRGWLPAQRAGGARPPGRSSTGGDRLKALASNGNHRTERVFLVGVELKSRTSWDVTDSLDELVQLAETAGGEVLGNGVQKLEAPLAATFIGPGKAQEFANRQAAE